MALDAIRSVDLLAQPADNIAPDVITAELDAGYGVFSGREARWATLLFTPEAAQWVANERWHPNQRLEPQPDGSLRMTLPYTDDTELAMDVLRHGAQVRVEAPDDLVREVAQRARAAAAQYL